MIESNYFLRNLQRFHLLCWMVFVSLILGSNAYADTKEFNGFQVDNITIPLEEVRGGGPPKDGIPSIKKPKFIGVNDVDFLADNDLVISFGHDGDIRAYPLRIIVWHEVVNDVVGGKAVAITYCPLCGTSMVFDRVYNGLKHSFGVSGLLYNSDVLLYDYEKESLWSQLKMQAVSGPEVGQKLTWLTSTEMTWGAWKTKYPKGKVLSTDTGYKRNYSRMGYQKYFASPDTMFPVAFTRTELAKKNWVIGVKIGEKYKAYPLNVLETLNGKALKDTIGGESVTIHYSTDSAAVSVRGGKDNELIPHVKLYWFAWQAFYPDTALYSK